MEITESFDTFFVTTKHKKTNDALTWKKYYLLLEELLNVESNNKLVDLVEQLGLLTDLIDDLMDKDKPEYFYLIKHTQELSKYLWTTLEKIKILVPQSNFKKFVDCITQSLVVQSAEDHYKLNESSSEDDYYYLVQRSIKLMQSFIYLIDPKPSWTLLKAIEYLAIKFQIMNDLNNFNKELPSDFLNNKGTLPLLKLLTYAQKQNKKEMLHLLIHSSYEERKGNIEEIKNALSEYGIQTYGQMLAISYSNRARDLLLSICSDKKKVDSLLVRKESFKR
ncbi:hypothetical protein BKP56_03525 [Marinilactibacillus sp. 15R]|uniref:class 1 isoprenoid biosynthesis enzyme n=1 Tax=Marinilactibacillus sp. 15R TaxID=1911586 RepID=UPI00090BABC6|nr:class 1 isoprenoid biosynthesis enzyme [Marinilactibacillus sp. 15R]API88424.1 hypothetical protein BKP56_03525 [Marinilactibacillus sp. 15R]